MYFCTAATGALSAWGIFRLVTLSASWECLRQMQWIFQSISKSVSLHISIGNYIFEFIKLMKLWLYCSKNEVVRLIYLFLQHNIPRILLDIAYTKLKSALSCFEILLWDNLVRIYCILSHFIVWQNTINSMLFTMHHINLRN